MRNMADNDKFMWLDKQINALKEALTVGEFGELVLALYHYSVYREFPLEMSRVIEVAAHLMALTIDDFKD